ncbi:MAG TPA: hypothetical protein DEQ02_02435 [Ruminococcaceae bacterium]|nr:hypothetical protein [Oscillospiraceae bacterium]
MKLNSYEKVWKVEKKIYSLANVHLPFPIKPVEMGYFLATALILFILDKITPLLFFLPALLKYVVMPYGIMKFLLKKKLDGKPPQKYFIDYFRYLLDRKSDLEFYRQTEQQSEEIKIHWDCTSRNF